MNLQKGGNSSTAILIHKSKYYVVGNKYGFLETAFITNSKICQGGFGQ